MHEWLLRLLFRLYPGEMRAAHGDEMLEVARHRWGRERRRARRGSSLRFWRYFLGDLVRAVPEAYLSHPGTPKRPELGPASTCRPRWESLMSVWNDVRVAARCARREPGFTLALVAVLAIGIGANTAIFGTVDAVLLNEPPYPEPDRLVLANLDYVDPETGAVEEGGVWSYPKFEVLRGNVEQIRPVAGYTLSPMTLSGRGLPARLDVEIVSPAYFELLGVAPSRGTALPSDDDAPLSVVLSDELWRSRFGADPAVLGATVTLEGQPLSVAGVMPAGFRGVTGAAELWIGMRAVPVLQHPRRLEMRFAHWFHALGRLAPGTTLESAQSELDLVNRELDASYRWEGQTQEQRVRLERLTDARANPTAATSLYLLMAAVGMVLLITCANVAGLLAVRNTARGHEFAIRAALGAGRRRLLRQQLTESFVVAGFGGLAGLGVAWLGIRALAAAWPETLTRGGSELELFDRARLSLGSGTLLFALAVTFISGVLFGVLPGLRGSRADLSRPLKDGGGAIGGAPGQASRSALAGIQIALATVLLVVAGLMLGSLLRLHAVELGFVPDRLLTFRYGIPRSSPAAEDPAAFHTAMMEGLQQLPGVSSIGLGCIPLQSCDIVVVTRVVGEPPFGPDDQGTMAHYVSEDYFETLQIRLIGGRGFSSRDRDGAPLVAIVNETAARQFFPGDDPLGREFAVSIGAFSDGANARVVGVVEDVAHREPGSDPFPIAYFPVRQISYETGRAILRTEGDPLALVDAVRRTLANIDPDLAIHDVATMESRLDAALADTRVIFWMLALFAATAVLLACFGVYGLIAFSVSRRTRELGLRIALGARGSELVRLVVRQGLVLTAAGLAAGVLAATVVSRWVESLLYEVEALDRIVYATVAGILLAVALMAAWLPARRAVRIDPMIALRKQ